MQDIVETKDAFELHADAPGFTPQDIDVKMQDGVLTISGKRTEEKHEEQGEKVTIKGQSHTHHYDAVARASRAALSTCVYLHLSCMAAFCSHNRAACMQCRRLATAAIERACMRLLFTPMTHSSSQLMHLAAHVSGNNFLQSCCAVNAGTF
eukprot:GHRR01002592.1.p1 GENE.GHRR01002592.1~~GHRR01002592.1.p1  ORF type:complete len:151 (+),score=40.95 GHRR01002592.1:548-1000(+)